MITHSKDNLRPHFWLPEKTASGEAPRCDNCERFGQKAFYKVAITVRIKGKNYTIEDLKDMTIAELLQLVRDWRPTHGNQEE